jgi:hypothetical protein
MHCAVPRGAVAPLGRSSGLSGNAIRLRSNAVPKARIAHLPRHPCGCPPNQLSGRSMAASAVRLQRHALARDLANLSRSQVNDGCLTCSTNAGPREKLVKIGTKVISHACYAVFRMVMVAVPRALHCDNDMCNERDIGMRLRLCHGLKIPVTSPT